MNKKIREIVYEAYRLAYHEGVLPDGTILTTDKVVSSIEDEVRRCLGKDKDTSESVVSIRRGYDKYNARAKDFWARWEGDKNV